MSVTTSPSAAPTRLDETRKKIDAYLDRHVRGPKAIQLNMKPPAPVEIPKKERDK